MSQTCYYCGIQLDSSEESRKPTTEHVPPKVFYRKVREYLPEKIQIPTLLSCPAHNTLKCGDPNLDQKIVGNFLYDLDARSQSVLSLPPIIVKLIERHLTTVESTKRGRYDVQVRDSAISLTRIPLDPTDTEKWIRMLLAAVLTHCAGQQMSPSIWSDAIVLNKWVANGSEGIDGQVERGIIINERSIKLDELERHTSWKEGASKHLNAFPSTLFSVTFAVNQEWVLLVRICMFREYISYCAVRDLSREILDRVTGWTASM